MYWCNSTTRCLGQANSNHRLAVAFLSEFLGLSHSFTVQTPASPFPSRRQSFASRKEQLSNISPLLQGISLQRCCILLWLAALSALILPGLVMAEGNQAIISTLLVVQVFLACSHQHVRIVQDGASLEACFLCVQKH